VGSRLNITGDRVFVNVDKYGNTSSASIPLAISEARAAGRIKTGDRLLVTAFGSGLTWGAALLRF
ncbi:MAG: 3-oxoacyl-[acyl-carrier-protein] synthase III C-terminal domain-containing protein, partial [Desulfovibrio sp.]|nr:3-oxoacyl-[acyl-carrier-protein] synthase III C-terminal domain-containing protein [Desulfovibrio sp.]